MMNLTQITNTGTISQEIELPTPWPPHRAVLLWRQTRADGELVVSIEARGYFRARLIETGSQTPLFDLVSCPIIATPRRRWVNWSLCWQTPSRMEMYADDSLIASAEHPDAAPSRFIVALSRGPVARPIDLALQKQNENARKRRRDTWLGFKPGDGKIDGGRDHVRTQLRDRTDLLKEHVDGVRRGERRHTIGVAQDLRSLIVMSRPMPQLQQCAAADDRSLIVYSLPSIPFPPSLTNGLVMLLELSVRRYPDSVYNTAIDLDVWLEQPAFISEAGTLTHKKLVSEIGSTIGAHGDRAILPTVITLRAQETGAIDVETTLLEVYLTLLAEIVISLAEAVLDDPKTA
jgi:hypothetical protein